MEKANRMIYQSGLNNNNISNFLNDENMMNSTTMNTIMNIIDVAKKLSTQMKDVCARKRLRFECVFLISFYLQVRRESSRVSDDVYTLKLKLSNLEPEMDSKFGLAEENSESLKHCFRLSIFLKYLSSTGTQTLRNIRLSNNTLHVIENYVNTANDNFKMKNDSLSLKLQLLRDNIAKAKHAAEGVS